ncbi:hypothetical protein PVAP13_2NG223709 [Panicum virgatum]|uniref:Ubiquitin-like domain-containing protein n=1 Tax=Panicum virgatum TaxID=38727 RepID=A0A8T0VCE9_PANVG|nr:hypothetical protein PVAP13_2NG223709 [Panicum virgatum]
MAAAGDEPATVEVTLRAVGPSRPTTLRLPPLLSVAELRRRIARDRHLAATEEARLRLVLRGRTLPHQDDAQLNLRDGDTLIVAVAPKPPAKHLRDDDDEEEEEEELKFKIPQTTTWWKRKIFMFLRDKMRLPVCFFRYHFDGAVFAQYEGMDYYCNVVPICTYSSKIWPWTSIYTWYWFPDHTS